LGVSLLTVDSKTTIFAKQTLQLSRMDGFHLALHQGLYVKDPTGSPLGIKLLTHATELLDELGLEQFTFRKLAERMESTEPTVYRYFENKHRLLLYLSTAWWGWQEMRLISGLARIDGPQAKLDYALHLLTAPIPEMTPLPGVQGPVLHRIMVAEFPKAYLTKGVDAENQEGLFLGYKRFCSHLAQIIIDLSPEFPFPRMLASTVVEASIVQPYFQRHLPRLTDLSPDDPACSETQLAAFLQRVIHGACLSPQLTSHLK
jgi:AcrR family transcriptional regulator